MIRKEKSKGTHNMSQYGGIIFTEVIQNILPEMFLTQFLPTG